MMKNKNKVLILNILSVALVQGIAFFTAPLFSRILGTDNYGIVQIFNTWTDIFQIVFSLSAASTICMVINEYSTDEQQKYHSSILGLILCSYGFWLIIISIFIKPISTHMKLAEGMVILCVICSLAKYIITFVNSKFVYEFKADKNFVIALVVLLTSIGLSLLLIPRFSAENNYWGRIIGITLSNVPLGLAFAIYIFKNGRCFYNRKYWSFCIKYSTPVIFHSLSNIVLGQSDRIMIQSMLNNSEVGIYCLAYNFGSIITIIYGALNNSWTPFYFDYLKTNDISELKKHADTYSEVYCTLAVGFLYLYPEVYAMYAPLDYHFGTDMISILVIGFVMMFFYSFCVNYEFYLKKTKFMAVLTASTAVINIVLNYFMIPKYGIYGAAIATAISYFIDFAVHYIYVKFFLKSDFPFGLKFFGKHLGAFIVFWTLFFLFRQLAVVRWSIAIIIGARLSYKIIKRKSIF